MANAESRARRAPASLLRPALLLAAGLATVACSGAGGEGTGEPTIKINPGALKVIYVDAQRMDNWARNKPIEIRFSAPLSKKSLEPSIISRAIQIGVVTSTGRIPAKGSFDFFKDVKGEHRDRVIFYPTMTARSDDFLCADNPFGFDPLTTYDITIPTPAMSKKYLTSVSGDPIVEAFDTFFSTGEGYAREIRQPLFVGTDGLGSLGFDPPRQIDGEVPYNARFTIVFDEPMDPASFELGNTIIIKNETLTPSGGPDFIVPGTFTPDVCGKSWRFAPAFSYGGAGYDIAVVLTTGLKDLAGNPMANPQTIRFRTEVKAGVPTTAQILESFDNTLKRDTPNTNADWAGTTVGQLKGAAVTSTVTTVALTGTTYPGGVRTRVRDHPFAASTSSGVGHDQWIYTQGEIGAAGAITGMDWGPSSNALFASFHTQVTVTLGHTQGEALSTNMANNFDVGLPVKVCDAQYIIPQRATIDPPCNTDACAVGYWPLPSFSNFFEYNGKNNLVVDVDAALGTNYQITRIFFGPVGFPNRHTFGSTGGTTGTLVEPVVTDMRFTLKQRTSLAQSLFYDSGQTVPNYGTPVILPATQTGGTAMQIEFEGADGVLFPIPGNPNNIIPDPTTYSGFVTNVDQLDGYRFLRFRATFVANVNTGEVPFLNSVLIPFIF